MTEQYAIDKAMELMEAELSGNDGPSDDPLLVDCTTEMERQYAAEADIAGNNWNPVEWVIGKLHELDAAEEHVKQQAKLHMAYLLSEIKARREGLLWKRGLEVRAIVDAELAGKKRKSITYATGKAGYTAGRDSVVIDDETKLIAWAEKNCPSAIEVAKTVRKKDLLDYFKKTGDEPVGAHVENPGDVFFIGPEKLPNKALPEIKTRPLLHMSADDFFATHDADLPEF